MAVVLSGQIARSIQMVDVVLAGLQRHINDQNIGASSGSIRIRDLHGFQNFLLHRLASLPLALHIVVADNRGQLVVSTAAWPTPDINVADRDYFKDIAAAGDNRLSMSLPFDNRVTGEPTIVLARRISGPGRIFLGIVFISVRKSYFESIYGAVDSLADQTFSLFRTDGTLIVRYPDTGGSSGQKIPATRPFHRSVLNGGGSYRSTEAFDPVVRWIAVNPLKEYPLVVTLAVPEDVILKAWRERAIEIVIGTLVFLACALVLFSMVLYQKSRLRMQNARFDAALTSLSEGLAMFDGDKRLVFCNARYREMLRLTPVQARPGRTLREIVTHCRAHRGFPADVDKYIAEILAIVATRKSHRYEAQDIDGHILSIMNDPMPDGGWVATLEDITDRRASEVELRTQNQRFDAALNNMSHGLVMFDAEARLVVCNDRYVEMYGLSREHIKPGCTLREVLCARQKLFGFPTDLESYLAEFMASVSRRESATREIRFNDGRVIQITRHPMDNGGWVTTQEDITDRRASEEKLRMQNQRFDAALNNMSQGLAVFDRDARLVVCNERYRELVRVPRELTQPGCSLRDIIAQRHAHYGVPANVDDYLAEIKRKVSGPKTVAHELQFDGRVLSVNNERMSDGGWVATYEDITDRRRAEAKIERLAHNDLLTGIANRPFFLDQIEVALENLRKNGQPFTVLMLDLDRLKHVNDSLGHAAGDALLKGTARRLEASLRSADVLARLGGDEFAIIQVPPRNFKSSDDAFTVMRESAIALANRIIDLIGQPFDIDGHKAIVGTSIGIAMAPNDGVGADELMKKADLALYKTKSEGRNGYSFFDKQLAALAAERTQLEEDLRSALERNEFELYYQPLIDVATRRTCAMEALVRWHHPERGLIMPDRFIPLAEDTGLISLLGEWILQAACAEAAHWPANVKVAVNISPVQFHKTNLFDVIMWALADSGLPPERLEIEITERVLLEHDADHLSTLHQLKNLGISIALDDFGTGHSSIGYLKMFPFDKIKIDRSFTQDLSEHAAIVCAVINLGRSLDIVTVAEGVETQAQLQILRAAGANQMQGYLFGRPMPATQLVFDEADASADETVGRQTRAGSN